MRHKETRLFKCKRVLGYNCLAISSNLIVLRFLTSISPHIDSKRNTRNSGHPSDFLSETTFRVGPEGSLVMSSVVLKVFQRRPRRTFCHAVKVVQRWPLRATRHPVNVIQRWPRQASGHDVDEIQRWPLRATGHYFCHPA